MTDTDAEVKTGALVGGLAWRRGTTLEPDVCALLEGKNVCVVSTVGTDGRVHAIPVWVDTDGTHVLLNSVGGRAWVRNLERDPQVTCTILQDGNLYEFVEIRGRVVERTIEGADAHIHRLARKYLDLEEYPWLDAANPRLLFRVLPQSVFHMQPAAPELEEVE